MIWRGIRLLLVVTSMLGIGLFLHLLGTRGPPEWIYAMPPLLLLNLGYLLFYEGRAPPSQIFSWPSRVLRLLGLWLEAKEAELRKRAKENSN
jgi:hypothetical protein